MPSREELKQKLRDRIGEHQIKRSSKENREKVFSKGLKDMGIDEKKFKEDLENIKKQGGLNISLDNN
tara:strand:- start:989 stop:1189 length:201 start_codon:yes stop_codon:yes gene_type:complete